MRHPVQCTYLPQTSVGHAVWTKKIIKLYIYKCTELRFYHKTNMILKQQKITHVFHDEQTKKKNVRKEKNNATKKSKLTNDTIFRIK